MFLPLILAPTDLYKYSPDAVPRIHAVSYHVATDKVPAQNGDKLRYAYEVWSSAELVKLTPDISPIPPLYFTGGKKCKIRSQFSTSVAYEPT